MKTAVAIAASLLMLAAFAARAATGPSPEPQRASAPSLKEHRIVAPTADVLRIEATDKAPTASVKAVEPAPVALPQEKAGASGMPEAPTIARQLARELGLSSVQRSSVESILVDRHREIEAYFAEIRARKVFTLEEWSRRTKGIKEGSYRRIEALLDARQASAFLGLLERNGLNDTIAFKVPDDVANLDDFKD
ncbi:MAG TPA: hypothetical protein VEJ18_02390 [Planctomycetota bacterium]|nr:hypothetical protein [Planctomycetota bacterium]